MHAQANLDRNTMYELIQGHGRTDMLLFYATVVGDFERVIQNWILDEEWTKAIDALSRQVRSYIFLHNSFFDTRSSQTSSCITVSALFLRDMLLKRWWMLGFDSPTLSLCVSYRPCFSYNICQGIHYLPIKL